MRTIFFYFVLIFGIITIAKAENPYKQFGCEGKELLTEQEITGEKILVLVASDTTNDYAKIIFNFDKMSYAVYNRENIQIKTGIIHREIPKRWLSKDPMESKRPDVSPYISMGNSPIVLFDPSGEDEVYFNWQGEEVKRIKSDKIFKTYVGDDKNWHEAEMPKIIEGYEDPLYQQYDYLIAAQTFIFNTWSKEARPTKSGQHLEGDEPVSLDPTIVKAMIIAESKAGQDPGRKGQNADQDIMQVNAFKKDWDKAKKQMGLEKGVTPDPVLSVYAGIRWLYYKGLVANPIYDGRGNFVKIVNVTWSGGDLNSWWNAVENYNGGGNESYLKVVKSYYNNAIEPSSLNYVNVTKKKK